MSPLERLKKGELTAERIRQEREEKLKIAEIERLSDHRKKFFDKILSVSEGERITLEVQIQQLDKKIKLNNTHLEEIREHIHIIDNLIFIHDNKKALDNEGIMPRLAKLPKSKLDKFLGKVNLKDQTMTDSILQMLTTMETEYGSGEKIEILLRMIIPKGIFHGLEKIEILLRMIRPQGTISPLCACFAGMYLANMGFPSYIQIIFSFILFVLLWSGGIILNDYYDYEADAITEPDRQIPSGKISRQEVLYASILLMLAAFLLSLFISIKLSIIVSFVILLIVLYNSTLKRMGLIGSFSFGIIEGLSFVIGVFIIDAFNQALLFMAISVTLMHTSVNMIGAIKDIEGDTETGNWTVAAKYGIDVTTKLAIFLLLLSLTMAYIPGRLNLLSLRYMPVLIIITIWLIITTIIVKNESKFGYMALGMYEMGASIYYISFITGI